jgi:hypothetical protein
MPGKGNTSRVEEAEDASVESRLMDALCAMVGVTANEVLGMRAYQDRYVVVVADGRKVQLPAETVWSYSRQAVMDQRRSGSEV